MNYSKKLSKLTGFFNKVATDADNLIQKIEKDIQQKVIQVDKIENEIISLETTKRETNTFVSNIKNIIGKK